MRKIKALVAAGAVAIGVLAQPISASAESVYTFSDLGFCFHASAEGCNIGNVSLVVYTTYTYHQIWINGKVYCTHGGGWVITWCSNTNNGKSYLNVGMNWTGTPRSGLPDGETTWARINVLANGAGCSWWGGETFVTIEDQCYVRP